jgi:hypothetical protein
MLPELATEILLGMSFLVNNEAIINLKEDIFTLDGKQYEIETTTSNKNNLNQKLTEKTKIYKCLETNDGHKEISKIVSEFRKSMPTIGKIKNSEHSINLTEQTPIALKGFKLPISIYEQTKKELEKMLVMKIIRKSLSPYSSLHFPSLRKTEA